MIRSIFILLTVALLAPFKTSAQEEKKSVKLALNYFKINDQASEVRATVKSKVGKKLVPVADIEVEFFLGEQSSSNSLGKAKSGRKGVAVLELSPMIAAKIDSISPFKLIAFAAES